MFVTTHAAEKIIEGLKKVSEISNIDYEKESLEKNLYFSGVSEIEMKKFILWLQNSFEIE